MKTIILVALAAGALSAYVTPSRAFADIYSCDLLSDSEGNRIFGGPAYEVQVEDSQVILITKSGGDTGGPIKTTRVPMRQTSDLDTASTYEAGGVRTQIIKDERNGTFAVTIYVRDVSAQCLLLDSEV